MIQSYWFLRCGKAAYNHVTDHHRRRFYSSFIFNRQPMGHISITEQHKTSNIQKGIKIISLQGCFNSRLSSTTFSSAETFDATRTKTTPVEHASAEQTMQLLWKRIQAIPLGKLKLTNIQEAKKAIMEASLTSYCSNVTANISQELLFRLMEENTMGKNKLSKPTLELYTAAIQAWKKALPSTTKTTEATVCKGDKAQEILDRVGDLYAGDMEMHPDTSTLQLVMSTWLLSDHSTKDSSKTSIQNAQNILDFMEELYKARNLFVQPNTNTYTSVLLGWCRHQVRFGESHTNTSNMRRAPSKQDPRTTKDDIDSTLGAVMAENMLDRMLLLRETIPNLNIHVSLECFKSCIHAWTKTRNSKDKKNRKQERIERILNLMTSNGIADISCFSMAINSYSDMVGSSDVTSKVLSLLDRMERHYGIRPDTRILNAVLYILSNNVSVSSNISAIESAQDILSRMEQSTDDQKPNAASYTNLMKLISRSGHKNSANMILQILNRMEERKRQDNTIKLDTVAYTMCIDAVAKSRNRDSHLIAEQILERMIERCKRDNSSVKPNSFTFSTVINACANNSSVDYAAPEKAERLLIRMIELGEELQLEKPDAPLFNAVINCWAKSRLDHSAEKAEALLLRMQHWHKSGITDVRPDTVTYTTVINAWCNKGGVEATERAQKLLELMYLQYKAGGEKRSCRPDSISFTAVIDGWARCGKGREAQLMLDRMTTLSLEPSRTTYALCLNAWSRSSAYDPDAALQSEKLLRQMQVGGKVQPDSRCYNMVIHAYANSRGASMKAKKAWEILNEMKQQYTNGDLDCKPDVFSYTSVINACARSPPNVSDPEMIITIAEQAMRELRESSLFAQGPNSITYTALLKTYAKHLPFESLLLKEKMIRKEFEQCCIDGYVNDYVLDTIRAIKSDVLLKQLIPSGSIPSHWSRNVKE